MSSSLTFNPRVIAHRGASAYAPENTMIAFIKAAQLGVQWIEFDVMESADGIPVIFHDEMLDRTTNGHGLINHYPYAYLRTLDAGKWFDPLYSSEIIPTFAQTVELLTHYKLCANVEIKPLAGRDQQLIAKVLTTIALHQEKLATILYSSFSIDALYTLRKLAPDALIGLLLHEWDPNWKKICKELNCVSVHVNEEILTEAFVQDIKREDKIVLSYTVNDATRAKELFAWGCDAVFTDFPDKIESSLGEVQV